MKKRPGDVTVDRLILVCSVLDDTLRGPHVAGFNKDTQTYRGQAFYSLLTDVTEGLMGIMTMKKTVLLVFFVQVIVNFVCHRSYDVNVQIVNAIVVHILDDRIHREAEIDNKA